jgi:hypothetical protein
VWGGRLRLQLSVQVFVLGSYVGVGSKLEMLMTAGWRLLSISTSTC